MSFVGIEGFVTDHIALFIEGKYTYASFQFEDAGLSGAGIKGIYAAPAIAADYRGISDKAAESENLFTTNHATHLGGDTALAMHALRRDG